MIFQTIRFKLSLFVFLLLVFTSSVLSVATITILNQTIRNQIVKRAEALSKSSAAVAAYSLISGDPLGMDHIVFRGKESNGDIDYMAVVDTRMKIVVHSDIKKRGEVFKEPEGNLVTKSEDGTTVREVLLPSGHFFDIATPIVFKDKRLGTVFVGVNQSALREAQRMARNRTFILFAVILLVGLIGVLTLSFFITRPIRELSAGVEKLKEGKVARPLRIFSMDELGKLTGSFNRMAELIMVQQSELYKYTQELEEAYTSILKVLAVAIDARDPYTLGHSARVALHSLMIGEQIGLSKDQLEELQIASLFHDVGKLKTPDAILFKQRSLNPTEYNEIRHHPEDGAEILKKVKSLQKYVDAVKHHHENYDGQGYPDGLGGDRIPLYAAIISIADTFDAMTSTRPYRRAQSKEEAVRELEKEAGKQFHPDLVKAFVRAMEIGKEPQVYPNLAKVL